MDLSNFAYIYAVEILLLNYFLKFNCLKIWKEFLISFSFIKLLNLIFDIFHRVKKCIY